MDNLAEEMLQTNVNYEQVAKECNLQQPEAANDAVGKAQPLGCMKCELLDWRF